MRRPSKRRKIMEEMPLDLKAEKALQEAVAEAFAEHKLRGHPIIVWRDGKVVSIPPEEITVVGSGIEKPERQRSPLFYVKEKNQSYGRTKKQTK
ncbi:MAG: hypothetical protein AB1585_16340 [Thermodesulfobacteriota bacterium]